MEHRDTWQIGPERALPLDGPRLIGVLNVTPDSFSDGGVDASPADAVARGLALVEEGADVVDVGPESTRPGARPVVASEQIARAIPVIEGLRRRTDAFLSIDTTSAEVAEAALEAGCDAINDVSACTEDPSMLDLAARRACGLVLMHRLRPPAGDRYSDRYDEPPVYDDVVGVVRAFLDVRTRAAVEAGIARDALVVDPGLGFGKSVEQNFELMARVGELMTLGFPVLCAASRKSFIGAVSGETRPPERLAGSLAIAVAQWQAGVRLFRVHDVAAHRKALAVAAAYSHGHGLKQPPALLR
ncbi:MAG: dihydropteroate synthase [Planctomycetota bacterium]